MPIIINLSSSSHGVDHACQERLLDGFHKENERLSFVIKELETERNMRIALFYDEREEMNKELNRLRNFYHNNNNLTSYDVKEGKKNDKVNKVDNDNNKHYVNIDDNNKISNTISKHEYRNDTEKDKYYDTIITTKSKKSSETLRMELEMDNMIRILKEQLLQSESQMNERERELQQIIDRLQHENINYVTNISYLKLQLNNITSKTIINNDNIILQNNIKLYCNEIHELKMKLQWYIENQKLIEQTDNENKRLKLSYDILKQEFIKFGGDMKFIQKIINDKINNSDNNMKNNHDGNNNNNSIQGNQYHHKVITNSSSSTNNNNNNNNNNNDNKNETSLISSSNHIILNNSYNSNHHVIDKDKTNNSFTTRYSKNNQHRSFADIKKIK